MPAPVPRFLTPSGLGPEATAFHPRPTDPTTRVPGTILQKLARAFVAAQTVACTRGVPSLVAYGATLPAWLACAGIGIIGTMAARVVMALWRLSYRLPYQVPLCIAIGGGGGVLVGLVGFGL